MKIGIALSGGIDSGVAAYLLKKQGFEVIGITFKLFEEFDKTYSKAFEVAKKLEIPFYVLDLTEDFYKEVITYFVSTYKQGKTPNPCAICNKKIKFGKALKLALENLKIDKLATGHYVKLGFYKGEVLLCKPKDLKKDQSYFLALIDKNVLSNLLFPLGNYTKEEVKNMASSLLNFIPDESQDVCFLKGKTLKEFLSQYLQPMKGPLVYKERVIGFHQGFYFFTVGQRKGLNLALGKPVYVIKIDPRENKVILGDKKDLLGKGVVLEEVNLHLPLSKWENPFAQIRYRTSLVKVRDILVEDSVWKVTFENEVLGITPGQICVFYENGYVLGGGVIREAL